MSGIYIHIPFCSDFCTYCNFCSVRDGSKMRVFVDSIKKEINQKRDFFKRCGSTPSTLYIGGGTPSALPINWLAEIVESVIETFDPDIKEFTVEVNPEDVNRKLLNGLKAMGVDRISMGAQSFNDENLIWMNRRHNGDDTINAFNLIRQAGYDNVNLDLIFGYEMLSDQQWDYDLDTVASLSPEHISAYQLGVEANSTLADMVESGEYVEKDSESSAKQYSMLQSALVESGYKQYEVSNFSKKGKVSQHNSSYWERVPYLGLGPSAHSFYKDVREWNIDIIDRYIGVLMKDDPNRSYIRRERLSATDVFNESIMLGLRKNEGVKLTSLDRDILAKTMDDIKLLESSGSLIVERNTIRIPQQKLFVSDAIISKLFQ